MFRQLIPAGLLVTAVFLSLPAAAEFAFEERPGELVLLDDGKPWLSTVIGPYDPARRDETYKVFTHIYNFEGTGLITKGGGGKVR